MNLINKILREAMSVGAGGFSFDEGDFDTTLLTDQIRDGFLEHGDLLGIKGGWHIDYEKAVMTATTTDDIKDFLVNSLDMDEPQADEMIKSVVDYFGSHNSDIL